jgi:hypothetical protein
MSGGTSIVPSGPHASVGGGAVRSRPAWIALADPPVVSVLGSRPAGAWPHQSVGARSRDDGPPVGGMWTTCAMMP